MIDATIKILVPAGKRQEVLQTINALLGPIRNEPGCISCHCCMDTETEDILLFQQEWQSNEDLAEHLRSKHFGILLGLMKVLSIEPEIRFNTIVTTTGAETVTAARKPRMQ